MTGVSRETKDLLEAFERLVLKWNPKINLVARSTLPLFYERHVQDSLQLAGLVEKPKGKWVDLGSGGGFPAVPLSIHFRETPDVNFVLVESDQRKCAFLRSVSRELDLPIDVINSRIEDLPDLEPTFISARALASLEQLCEYSLPMIRHNAVTCFFPKGQTWQSEVKKARQSFSFSLEVFESVTQEGAAILKLEDLTRV